MREDGSVERRNRKQSMKKNQAKINNIRIILSGRLQLSKWKEGEKRIIWFSTFSELTTAKKEKENPYLVPHDKLSAFAMANPICAAGCSGVPRENTV